MRAVEFIKIIDEGVRPNLKTKLLTVRSVKTENVLGHIKWHGPWRQYAFYPAYSTVFNPDCMMAISKRCMAETSLHRDKKGAKL